MPLVHERGPAILEPALLLELGPREDEVLERAVRLDQDQRGRRLVDLAALDADGAVLDHVDPADAVRACALVQVGDEVDEAELDAVERDREALGKADEHFRWLGRVVRRAREHVRVLRRSRPRVLEDPRFDRAAEQVRVDRVRRRRSLRDRDAAGERVGDLVLPRPDAVAERRDHAHARVVGAERDLEAELVVPLARAAVDDGVGADLERDGGDRLGDHRARERGDERVLALVERVGLQRLRHLFVRELLAQLGDDDVVGARRTGTGEGRLQLDVLADVDEHGHDLVEPVVLLEPGDGAARVEAAREGEDCSCHAAPSME